MKKIIFALIFSIFFVGVLYLQNSFKYNSVKNGIYETAFKVLGIYDNSTSSNMIKQILKEKGVAEAKIFYNRRCKVISKTELYFDLIRRIVKSYNTYFQLGYCVIKDKITYTEIYKFSQDHKITDYKPQIIPANKYFYLLTILQKKDIQAKKKLKKQNKIGLKIIHINGEILQVLNT